MNTIVNAFEQNLIIGRRLSSALINVLDIDKVFLKMCWLRR